MYRPSEFLFVLQGALQRTHHAFFLLQPHRVATGPTGCQPLMSPIAMIARLGLVLLAGAIVFAAAEVRAATLTNAALTDDNSVVRTNQNLDAYGSVDWEIYSASSLVPYNRRNSPVDRITLSVNLDTATLSVNAQVNTSFDYTNGTTPVVKTGDNPNDLRMLNNDFSTNDFFTLAITPGSLSQQTVTVWGDRRVADVRITATLSNATPVVTELIGGGSTTEKGWFYQVQFTPDNMGSIFFLKIQGLAVSGTANERLGIEAVALDGPPQQQHLFAQGLFQNNMVLQRDMNAPVWGYALPAAVVTLKLDGATVATAVTDSNGKWLARIGSHPNDGGVSHTLEISSPGEISITLTNVVFGDVYIAAGQSNMARTMYNFRTDPIIAAETANANFPLIRQVTVSETTSLVPLQDPALAQDWTPCSPSTVGGFSATAFFFAKNMYLQTNVPVGLLFSAWGAKKIERFLAPEGVAAIPELAGEGQYVTTYGVYSDVNGFYDLYNAMIAPLIPYGVKGAIWYQGEWNSGDGDLYRLNMRALIAGWRKNWGQGNFPFYFVQLPNYADGGYPGIREAQLHTLSETNVGMAVTIDTGDGQLHPADKPDVGYRLAKWALAKDDGLNFPYSGPLISGVTNEGGQLRISFDHVDGGLMAGYKFTNNPVVSVPGAPLDDFEVAGADKVFVAASAKIVGNTVVVSNAAVSAPVYVRYCYTGWPAGTNHLYNTNGLPASPFRTDEDYPLTVQSGSGSNGALAPGAQQSITANAAPGGMVFDRWIGIAFGIDNVNAASATVTMPRHALYLLASYRTNTTSAYLLTVNQGFGTGTSQPGSSLMIEAQPAAAGYVFDRWMGSTQTVANVFAPVTTLQMPGSNLTVTATYRLLSTPASLRITSISPAGGNTLVLQGDGGPTNGGAYYWLRCTTNLALPLTNWSVVATNPFDLNGNFSNQIPMTPGTPQVFYRLQLP